MKIIKLVLFLIIIFLFSSCEKKEKKVKNNVLEKCFQILDKNNNPLAYVNVDYFALVLQNNSKGALPKGIRQKLIGTSDEGGNICIKEYNISIEDKKSNSIFLNSHEDISFIFYREDIKSLVLNFKDLRDSIIMEYIE